MAAPETPRPLVKAKDHPCFSCTLCCTYVATQIDAPRAMADYDHIVWYLHHAGLSVYVDWEGAWYLHIETRCNHLTPSGLCGIYDRRPAICKDFDWRDCEKQQAEGDAPPEKLLFRTADEFLEWLAERRPRTYARYQDFLARKHRGPLDPALARIERA